MIHMIHMINRHGQRQSTRALEPRVDNASTDQWIYIILMMDTYTDVGP
jgi:hypothetical protein